MKSYLDNLNCYYYFYRRYYHHYHRRNYEHSLRPPPVSTSPRLSLLFSLSPSAYILFLLLPRGSRRVLRVAGGPLRGSLLPGFRRNRKNGSWRRRKFRFIYFFLFSWEERNYADGGEEYWRREEKDRREKGEENGEKDEELKAKKETEINDMQENCIVARNYCLLH